MTVMEDPKRMNSVVRDREGDRWRRGQKMWINHDGRGRLPWTALQNMYGPLTQDGGTVDLEDFLRARRNRTHREAS